MVESAIIYSVTFLLIFGLIIGGLGVFRYQEVASLAREGSRYASVHGAMYEQVTGKPAATPADVYNNAILPKAVALDPKQLTYSVTWNPDNQRESSVTVTVIGGTFGPAAPADRRRPRPPPPETIRF